MPSVRQMQWRCKIKQRSTWKRMWTRALIHPIVSSAKQMQSYCKIIRSSIWRTILYCVSMNVVAGQGKLIYQCFPNGTTSIWANVTVTGACAQDNAGVGLTMALSRCGPVIIVGSLPIIPPVSAGKLRLWNHHPLPSYHWSFGYYPMGTSLDIWNLKILPI